MSITVDHVIALVLTAKDLRKTAKFYKDKIGFISKKPSDEFAYRKFSDD